jgi:hypothetical protein
MVARARTPIPCSMDLRKLTVTARDLALTGMLVSPLWLALGIAASDIVMIAAAIAVGIVATLHFKPGLVASRRDA